MTYLLCFGAMSVGLLFGWCLCALLTGPELLQLRQANRYLRQRLGLPDCESEDR